MTAYNFYSDPGHGWLEVPKTKILELGIEHKISTCSYTNTNSVFLEEDCDVNVFLQALSEEERSSIEFRELFSNHESQIRNYPEYNPKNVKKVRTV
jgi:hypothetical protein